MQLAAETLHTFTIYRSSAGSGKTRTLAKEYLKLALRLRSHYFKHILAVTFTNKATQEMKDRILTYLHEFATGTPGSLADELKAELNLDDSTFMQYAQETQSAILHDYAEFSISTIDAFFQKVIRSFTREAGLVGDYRLEIDQDTVLEEVIDNLIDELGSNHELTDWVVEFAKENLENEKAWDVRQNLIEFSKEIFKEEFKQLEESIVAVTANREYFHHLKSELWKTKKTFLNRVNELASQMLSIMATQPWGYQDLTFKSGSGMKGFLEMFAYSKSIKDVKEIGARIRGTFTDAAKWPHKESPHRVLIHSVAKAELVPRLESILQEYDRSFEKALSAEVALQNLYVFGLVADISRKLREYKDDNNLMLLADAPKFLNGVIQDSDTPFIYEKVGSFYRNFLIDEFQDTSGLQWKNFLPLITNSLDQGFTSLVVGDVKQAIYRWRGGDLNLLQSGVEGHIGKERTNVLRLSRNFRSASALVSFNNELFISASEVAREETGETIPSDAYADVAQQIHHESTGFVEVKFLQDQAEGPTWKDQALDEATHYLERLQEMGVPLKEIAFLVRRNEEGQQIIAHLLNYKNSDRGKPGLRYEVVSNESLRIDTASTVVLLEGALKYLLNPDDDIARAQLAYEYGRLHQPEKSITEVFAVTNQSIFESFLPMEYTREKSFLKKLPLFELTESLIRIFRLGEQKGELPHLQAFQNLVLDFYTRERNDLGAFMEWWEENKIKKSIPVSGNVDAAQVITVHKSKGLQFGYVIIPFCSWSMDHDSFKAPNLWVKGSVPPFDRGYLPVKYSSALEQTVFRDAYKTEFTRTYLDNMNLLYVALTRAENGLVVLAPDPTAKNQKKSVAQVLYKSIARSSGLSQAWKPAEGILRYGEWQVAPIKYLEAYPAIELPKYVASNWRDKLVIRHDAYHFFDVTPSDQDLKKNYGIYIHSILSRLTYFDQISHTISAMEHEGILAKEEKVGVLNQLDELMAIEKVKNWFSREWEVKTEVPILSPDGSESRIDRLLLKDRQAVVIDFKTGERVSTDKEQVIDYIEILRSMNFIDIEGYLLYLKTNEIVSVAPPKGRIVKKKDNNQLELGI